MFFYMFYSFHQYQIYVLCIFMYLFHSHIYLYIYSEKTEVKNVSLFCLHDMWFSPHSVVMLLNPSCRKQGPREPLQSSTSTYWRYKKKAYRHMQVCACVDTTDHAVPLVLRVSCFSWRATSCLNWPTAPFSPPLVLLMLLITHSCVRTATVRTDGIEKMGFIQNQSTLCKCM